MRQQALTRVLAICIAAVTLCLWGQPVSASHSEDSLQPGLSSSGTIHQVTHGGALARWQRRLQGESDDEADNRFAFVGSTSDLLRAVERGTTHIRITAHLDLTLTAVEPLDFQIRILSTVKSITGSCTDAPVLRDFNLAPDTPLLPLARGQCLLVTRSGFIKSASGPLWLDNLYIRREQLAVATGGETAESPPELTPLVVTDKPEGLLWATEVVFQSDGSGGAAAVEAFSSAYFEGCVFANFGAGSVPVLLHASGTVSFVDTEFADNVGEPGGQRDGLVLLDGVIGGAVRFERCAFQGNVVDYVAVDASDVASGRIFSDSAQVAMWRAATQEVLFAQPLQQADAVDFVNNEWEWFPITVAEASQAMHGAQSRAFMLPLLSLVASSLAALAM
eukprot:jgi/Ulvmu1/6343/UM029_0051.1